MARNFEIDITYRCNLACKWCDRLCGTEFRRPIDMTATQLERYVSIIAPHINRRSSIRILGGEPMLHPQIFKMLDILIQAIRPRKFPNNFYTHNEMPITFLEGKVLSCHFTFERVKENDYYSKQD